MNGKTHRSRWEYPPKFTCRFNSILIKIQADILAETDKPLESLWKRTGPTTAPTLHKGWSWRLTLLPISSAAETRTAWPWDEDRPGPVAQRWGPEVNQVSVGKSCPTRRRDHPMGTGRSLQTAVLRRVNTRVQKAEAGL